ncbi:MAG: hypothetical protein WBC44_06275 [Planctomycetaceae bacterium]
MNTRLEATVVDGALELDHPVELPDQTRVRVSVEPVAVCTDSTTRGRETGWAAMKRRIRERAIHAGRLHFTRDELHERD